MDNTIPAVWEVSFSASLGRASLMKKLFERHDFTGPITMSARCLGSAENAIAVSEDLRKELAALLENKYVEDYEFNVEPIRILSKDTSNI